MTPLDDLLHRLTKNELVALARAAGIEGRSKMTKAELIEALRSHLAPADDRVPPPAEAPARCPYTSERGSVCGLPAPSGACPLHAGEDVFDRAMPVAGRLGFDTWPALMRLVALGMYDTDPLGLDPVVSDMVWHLANFLYRDYFRVEVNGAENIPDTGPAIVVANHAGAALPYDGMMLATAVANEMPQPRRLRLVGTEIFNMLPFVSHLYRKSGAAYAAREDAMWLLRNGHLLGVFPEGVAGFQKAQRDAYRLRRFGRGGFVDLAMRTGAPIVPVAIVGSEEVHPVVFTSRRLATLVRTIFPGQRVDEMGVFLNPLPLPVKWHIEILEPVDVGGPTASPDRLAVLEHSEDVRSTIQHNLDRLLARRDGLF